MPDGTARLYRLRAGDSIRSVAAVAGTTPLKLMEFNPYLDPTALTAGQVLTLPPPSRPALWPFTAGLLHKAGPLEPGPAHALTTPGSA